MLRSSQRNLVRQVVECVFKDDGRIKSVYAKRARGLMARFVVTKRPTTLAELEAFDLEGYAFAPRESDDATLVFNRRCVAANPCRGVLAGGPGSRAPRRTPPAAAADQQQQHEADRSFAASILCRFGSWLRAGAEWWRVVGSAGAAAAASKRKPAAGKGGGAKKKPKKKR